MDDVHSRALGNEGTGGAASAAALRERAHSRRVGEIILLSGVLLFGAVFLASLRGLPFEAQLFPFVVICIMLGLSVARLAAVVRGGTGPALARARRDAAAVEPRARGFSPVVVWAWAAGTVAAMLTVGIVVGTGLSVLAYILMGRRESWLAAAGIASLYALGIYVVFGQVMEVNLHTGFLVHW